MPSRTRSKTQPDKLSDVMALVRACVDDDTVRYTHHGTVRKGQRRILEPHIEHVLLNGHRAPERDRYSEEHGSWSYAIEGLDPDGRSLRVIVAVVRPNLLVITCIALRSRKR